MSRIVSNRKIAEALLRTLQHLESDPTVDPDDPAFVNLKVAILQRIMELELDSAESQASIHLVELPDPQPEPKAEPVQAAKDEDTGTCSA